MSMNNQVNSYEDNLLDDLGNSKDQQQPSRQMFFSENEESLLIDSINGDGGIYLKISQALKNSRLQETQKLQIINPDPVSNNIDENSQADDPSMLLDNIGQAMENVSQSHLDQLKNREIITILSNNQVNGTIQSIQNSKDLLQIGQYNSKLLQQLQKLQLSQSPLNNTSLIVEYQISGQSINPFERPLKLLNTSAPVKSFSDDNYIENHLNSTNLKQVSNKCEDSKYLDDIPSKNVDFNDLEHQVSNYEGQSNLSIDSSKIINLIPLEYIREGECSITQNCSEMPDIILKQHFSKSDKVVEESVNQQQPMDIDKVITVAVESLNQPMDVDQAVDLVVDKSGNQQQQPMDIEYPVPINLNQNSQHYSVYIPKQNVSECQSINQQNVKGQNANFINNQFFTFGKIDQKQHYSQEIAPQICINYLDKEQDIPNKQDIVLISIDQSNNNQNQMANQQQQNYTHGMLIEENIQNQSLYTERDDVQKDMIIDLERIKYDNILEQNIQYPLSQSKQILQALNQQVNRQQGDIVHLPIQINKRENDFATFVDQERQNAYILKDEINIDCMKKENIILIQEVPSNHQGQIHKQSKPAMKFISIDLQADNLVKLHQNPISLLDQQLEKDTNVQSTNSQLFKGQISPKKLNPSTISHQLEKKPQQNIPIKTMSNKKGFKIDRVCNISNSQQRQRKESDIKRNNSHDVDISSQKNQDRPHIQNNANISINDSKINQQNVFQANRNGFPMFPNITINMNGNELNVKITGSNNAPILQPEIMPQPPLSVHTTTTKSVSLQTSRIIENSVRQQQSKINKSMSSEHMEPINISQTFRQIKNEKNENKQYLVQLQTSKTIKDHSEESSISIEFVVENILSKSDQYLLKDCDQIQHKQFQKSLVPYIFLKLTPEPKSQVGDKLFKNGLFLSALAKLVTRSTNSPFLMNYIYDYYDNAYSHALEKNQFVYRQELEKAKLNYHVYLQKKFTQMYSGSKNQRSIEPIKRSSVQSMPFISVNMEKKNNYQQTTPKKPLRYYSQINQKFSIPQSLKNDGLSNSFNSKKKEQEEKQVISEKKDNKFRLNSNTSDEKKCSSRSITISSDERQKIQLNSYEQKHEKQAKNDNNYGIDHKRFLSNPNSAEKQKYNNTPVTQKQTKDISSNQSLGKKQLSTIKESEQLNKNSTKFQQPTRFNELYEKYRKIKLAKKAEQDTPPQQQYQPKSYKNEDTIKQQKKDQYVQKKVKRVQFLEESEQKSIDKNQMFVAFQNEDEEKNQKKRKKKSRSKGKKELSNSIEESGNEEVSAKGITRRVHSKK